ncbi:CAI-1 autoinducer sensor kinase/phosphatase CqsS [Pedobacter glucosidilyticus]|nr:response regulator [Pedobacter glucosidilyticus]KHJ36520.1 CAI-1 autoinducer sensor kinase/phosphatase CqsS [Pedobacter glucosidilyticus]
MNTNKTILIFDDDVNILELCSIILMESGYQVEISETSHDIIEKVTSINPDVILMDNWIPDIGGIKATQLLKQHPDFKHIPVIYFSATVSHKVCK